jgi:hypothetical protein
MLMVVDVDLQRRPTWVLILIESAVPSLDLGYLGRES